MSRSLVWFINISLIITQISGARILAVFPTPSISHQVVFRPYTQELARRGHEVTIITPDPAFPKGKSPANLTEIDVHDVAYGQWKQRIEENSIVLGKIDSTFKMIELGTKLFGEVFEKQLKSSEVQKLLKDKSKKYDLLIVEACGRPAMMLTHLYKAPVIQISSFGMMFDTEDTIGAPSHPILYPSVMRQRLYNLTFMEKIDELYKHYWFTYKWKASEVEEHKMLSKYYDEEIPPYKELYNNVDMLFLNVHPIWSHNQPLPPNVISIWGIHKKPKQPLPQDLLKYLDSSKHGVIYLSFGSNAQSAMLPSEIIQMFINVFSKLKYDVLWKWEKDELPGKSDNIKISKWLPQSDLLHHPNIKLFITQGCLQSTDEAMNAGVPLVGIPMLGDQWYNVELYQYHKIGERLNLETINEEVLTNAIHTVINDNSYKENIKKLQALTNDQPDKPLDRAIWWTEYVLRHGGAKHLRGPAANMPWTEYYEIDFISKLLLILFSILTSILIVIYLLYKNLVQIIPGSKIKKS